jgi:hypothetical protein
MAFMKKIRSFIEEFVVSVILVRLSALSSALK